MVDTESQFVMTRELRELLINAILGEGQDDAEFFAAQVRAVPDGPWDLSAHLDELIAEHGEESPEVNRHLYTTVDFFGLLPLAMDPKIARAAWEQERREAGR